MRKAKHYIEEMDLLRVYQANKLQCDYISFRLGYMIALNKSSKLDADQFDFCKLLEEHELSANEFRESFENMDYIEDVPETAQVADSIVDGKGLYATGVFEKGDVIMMYEAGEYATAAKRFLNHSPLPNAKIIKQGNDLILKACKRIEKEEIMIDYRRYVMPKIDTETDE